MPVDYTRDVVGDAGSCAVCGAAPTMRRSFEVRGGRVSVVAWACSEEHAREAARNWPDGSQKFERLGPASSSRRTGATVRVPSRMIGYLQGSQAWGDARSGRASDEHPDDLALCSRLIASAPNGRGDVVLDLGAGEVETLWQHAVWMRDAAKDDRSWDNGARNDYLCATKLLRELEGLTASAERRIAMSDEYDEMMSMFEAEIIAVMPLLSDFGAARFEETSTGYFAGVLTYKGSPVTHFEQRADGSEMRFDGFRGDRYYDLMLDKAAQGEAKAAWDAVRADDSVKVLAVLEARGF